VRNPGVVLLAGWANFDGHSLMRVFVAATLPKLAELNQTGLLAPDIDSVFAVTPALREWYTDGDAEELEYAALLEAARASLGLLAAEPSAPPRRAVVAADVTGAVPDASNSRAGVRLAVPIRTDQVAALHIDTGDAEDTVRAAVAAYARAATGDQDAVSAVEEPEGLELLWYASQELPDLLHS
jgi:hypothetical protein